MKLLNLFLFFFLFVFITTALPVTAITYKSMEVEDLIGYNPSFVIGCSLISCVSLVCLFLCAKDKYMKKS